MINPTEKFRQNSINFKQTNFKLLDANSKRITHRSDEEQVVPGAVLECDILNLQGAYTKKGFCFIGFCGFNSLLQFEGNKTEE